MSDDVKVKFGGDFSDVPKGASAAAKQAGTAISSSFHEFTKDIGGKIAGAFAISAIFDRVYEGVKGSLEYFHELELAMKRTGASGEEFQKLASLGKSTGVSMEALGRSLQFANKYLGQSQQGSRSHQKALVDLGFTQEQVTAGNITATQIILKLAEAYEKTQNDTMIAAQATSFLGRQGQALLPIIKQGSSAIEEQTKNLKTYTDAEIIAAAAIEKRRLALERTEKGVWKKITAAFAGHEMIGELRGGGFGETYNNNQTLGQLQERFSYWSKEELLAILEAYGKTAFGSERNEKLIEQLKVEISKEKENKPTSIVEDKLVALTASSLQSIGGGDIASIYAGVSVQEAQLAAQEQTAANTGILAGQAKEGVKTTTRPTNVAK
jgi:hypothetical protein